jgi:hypothetical protein
VPQRHRWKVQGQLKFIPGSLKTEEVAFLPRCDGKQIAGNWDRLVEAVQLVSSLGGHGRLPDGQTTGHDWERRGDVEVKGALDIGGILAREDRSGVDSLALRD